MQEPSSERRCIIIGNGRAGGSFARALAEVGWTTDVRGRGSSLEGVTSNTDVVLITTPDDQISTVAEALPPGPAVVAHCSGSRTLDVLEPHRQTGSIHPLMSLPDPELGAVRLRAHCTFAVDGSPRMAQMVTDLGGVAVRVPGSKRAQYHAAASIASNHLTALCHQVEALAEGVGVPADAFWALMATTLENVRDVGPIAALTGPAARADWTTIGNHLDQLADDDRTLYLELSRRAATMAGHLWPEDLL